MLLVKRVSDFKVHLWKVCLSEACEGTEWFARASGFSSRGNGHDVSFRWLVRVAVRSSLSLPWVFLLASRDTENILDRQVPKVPPSPSLPLSLWFLASFTPSLSVCLLSWELYIQAVMLLGLLPEPPWHTPLKTPKVIEMQHFLSSPRGWPLTLAQNWLFSTLMHPCF